MKKIIIKVQEINNLSGHFSVCVFAHRDSRFIPEKKFGAIASHWKLCLCLFKKKKSLFFSWLRIPTIWNDQKSFCWVWCKDQLLYGKHSQVLGNRHQTSPSWFWLFREIVNTVIYLVEHCLLLYHQSKWQAMEAGLPPLRLISRHKWRRRRTILPWLRTWSLLVLTRTTRPQR